MFYEAETEYMEEDFLEPDAIYEEESLVNVGKYDGWLAVLLLFSLIFGPRTKPVGMLPPMRSADIIIILLVISRWIRSKQLYGGFVFSYRNRIFSWFMLALAFLLLFSTMINVAVGRYPFFIKDLYQPIVFIRMILIASIAASFYFGDRQVKQFSMGIIIISLMSVVLAFFQRFRFWYVSGLVERFYTIEWTRLEEMGIGARVVGTFGNPNQFGLCLVMLAAVSLAISINMKGFRRLLAIGTFVSLGLAVLMTTASRTALIALFMITAISLLLSLRGKAIIPVLLLTLLVFSILIFIRIYADTLPLNPRIKDMIGVSDGKSMSSVLYARYLLWERSIREVKESIVFGVGISKTIYQTTDNGYIIMLLRTGIIGLIIYISMLSALFIRGIKALHIEKRPFQRTVLLTSFIVLINHMIFELTGDFFWNVETSAILAAFIGLLCGSSIQSLEENYYQNQQYI
ncbi:MAG: O-antigen ligase family protein [Phycisphaerae bacterium]|nr:O-antigen ligase family protein [Phycisphaerae bacterium]